MHSITCWKTKSRLWDWAAGRLPEAEQNEIKAHLAHCAACATKAKRVQRTVQAIQTDRALPPPAYPNRWPHIEAGLNAAQKGEAAFILPRRANGRNAGLALCGVSAMALLAAYMVSRPAPAKHQRVENLLQVGQGSKTAMPSGTIARPVMPIQKPVQNQDFVWNSPRTNTPQNFVPLVSHRIPVVSDAVYLDGQKGALNWQNEGQDAKETAAFAKNNLPTFRDDFVSFAPPMLAGGGTPAQQSRENAAAMREYKRLAELVDTRLFRKVTLAEKGESVATVCAHLQTQTGVKMQGSRDVQDEKLTIFVREVPARDVLRAIARLFGYAWRRTGEEGKFRYALGQDLRSQFAEEEMRSRDTNAALLALDEEMKKRLTQGEKQKDWGYVQLYDQLTPADSLALRGGATVEFDPDSPQAERQVSPEIQHLLLPGGADFSIDENSDNWLSLDGKRGVPYSKFAGTRVGASYSVSHSELGQLELQATPRYMLWLPKIGKSRLGIYGEFPQTLATGKNPSSANPNNAKWNAALANLPTFKRIVTLQPKHACHGKRLDKDDDPMTPNRPAATVEDLVFQPKTYFRQHMESSDVWEEIHKKTGMPIVADYYSRLYPADVGNAEGKTLFTALCHAADGLGVRWKKDGDFLLCRSTSYFWDKQKEVPRRLLDRWLLDSRSKEGLPLDDLLEMANCSDVQLDSLRVALTLFDCWGLNEWERVSIGRDGRMDSIFGGPDYRTFARYLSTLPPDVRAAFLRPEGCEVDTLLPAQKQELERILESNQWGFGNRICVSYVPCGQYVWNPAPGSPFTEGIIALRVVSGRTPEEALAAAQKIDPTATAAHIHLSRSVFAITTYNDKGKAWVRGTPGETMNH